MTKTIGIIKIIAIMSILLICISGSYAEVLRESGNVGTTIKQ